MLFMQPAPWARLLAFDSEGSSIAAKMAMIAITTNSLSVNPSRSLPGDFEVSINKASLSRSCVKLKNYSAFP